MTPRRKPSPRVRLDPRFEEHKQIPGGECPGGVVMRLVSEKGEVIHERKLKTTAEAELWAAADRELSWEGGSRRLYLYGYDGDTGKCLGTMIAEPA